LKAQALGFCQQSTSLMELKLRHPSVGLQLTDLPLSPHFWRLAGREAEK
jgi:hypothetical protein